MTNEKTYDSIREVAERYKIKATGKNLKRENPEPSNQNLKRKQRGRGRKPKGRRLRC